jgi:5-methylcytosine-specific restriction endonuclease McrA
MPAGVLSHPTLVLNRNWQPIRIATVARALVMVFNGTARVVDPETFQTFTWGDWSRIHPRDGDRFVQAVTMRLKAPEVVVLNDYDRVPANVVTFSRRNLFKRDHYVCQYCGRQAPPDELTIDHIVPRSQGGESTWENCVVACLDCNKRKGNRTPDQAGMRLRRKPMRPKWQPLYALREIRIESWSKFISEAYWNVELER